MLDTRTKNGVKTRRHECGNGHRFKTIECYEVLGHYLSRPMPTVLATIGRGIEARRIEYLRGVQMARAVAAGESIVSVAERYGVHRNTVARQVRKNHRQPPTGTELGQACEEG